VEKRVLLIDDEKDIVELLQMTLEEEGYIVCIAGNGPEAVAEMKKAAFDFIVCDVNMPGGMSGVNVYDWKKSANIGGQFLFLTGHAKGSAELADVEKAGVPILTKPHFLGELLSLLEAA
jgi:CheY-like chemotaxis protein